MIIVMIIMLLKQQEAMQFPLIGARKYTHACIQFFEYFTNISTIVDQSRTNIASQGLQI